VVDGLGYPAGATPLDPDEAVGLKLGHITTREELNRFEQANINEAFEWLESHRSIDILTEPFIKMLHQKMFGRVWRWAGLFRKSSKNIGVDRHQLETQLHTLLQDTRYWINHKTYAEDEIAARFHHKLVWIHLFANGNGRHARLMTDLLLKEVLQKEPFTWDIIGMDVENQVRGCYIKALKKADNNDYSLLMEFVRSTRENR